MEFLILFSCLYIFNFWDIVMASISESIDTVLLPVIEELVTEMSIKQTLGVDEHFTVHRSNEESSGKKESSGKTSETVDFIFGPSPPSSSFLASQLFACYRREVATSGKSADGSKYRFVESMPKLQCLVFKKTMKKRIHEWEAAVRSETGESEVRSERKDPLRPLYELYTASKNRIAAVSGSSEKPTETGTQSHRQSAQGTNQGAVAAVHGSSSASQTSAAATEASSTRNSAHSASSGQPAAGPLPPIDSSTTSHQRDSAAIEDQDTQQREIEDSRIEAIINRLPQIRLHTTDPAAMSTQDLAAEKHHLKQLLYRFETEVIQALGYRPPRNGPHRQRLLTHYQRYRSLRDELQARNGSAATSEAGDM